MLGLGDSLTESDPRCVRHGREVGVAHLVRVRARVRIMVRVRVRGRVRDRDGGMGGAPRATSTARAASP